MGLIDGMVGAMTSLTETAMTNAINKQMHDESIAWQKEENEIMRQREDNAIVRRMNDLANAGINPLLAGNVGGASAMAGNVIPAMQIQKSNAGDIIANIMESEARINKSKADVGLTNKQKELTEEQAKEVKERTRLMIESAPTKEQQKRANEIALQMGEYDLYRASVINDEINRQIRENVYTQLDEKEKKEYENLLTKKLNGQKLTEKENKKLKIMNDIGMERLANSQAQIEQIQRAITKKGLEFTMNNITLKNYISLISDVIGVANQLTSPVMRAISTPNNSGNRINIYERNYNY